jgi:hypothetical protein
MSSDLQDMHIEKTLKATIKIPRAIINKSLEIKNPYAQSYKHVKQRKKRKIKKET